MADQEQEEIQRRTIKRKAALVLSIVNIGKCWRAACAAVHSEGSPIDWHRFIAVPRAGSKGCMEQAGRSMEAGTA